MASKYQIIVGMAEHTARDITQNPDNWMSFLTTAASNYKYKFKDQILIHAQKPNATACAEIETWNRLGRWVNKGTKGIALLSDKDIPYRLRHVFDVSDTNTRVGAHISLWQMRGQYTEAVTEALENSFGAVESKGGLASTLLETAKNAVEDNFSDYLSDLRSVKGDSFLEELDELNTEVWFKTALTNSVAFILLTRCGMDAREYFDREDFVRVFDFSTPQTVAILGGAASDISEMVLREIGATVKNLQMEERKQNRTFADNRTSGYNDSGNKTTERSQEYGTDLYNAGRLPSARPDRAGESDAGEIWNAAAQLPERPQGRDLHGDAADEQAERASDGDRPAGNGDDGTPDRADGKGAWRDGESESIGSDEMGADDEQHQERSGGDRPDGANLQLSGHDFNRSSGIAYYHENDEKNELLRTCNALKNHRQEITAFFASHEDRKERGDFIRSFFNNTFTEIILKNGQRAGYRAYQDVLHLWRGKYLSREKEVYLYWPSVADTVNGMMLLDRWLDPSEKMLPTQAEQMSLIEESEAQKASAFSLPQEAIDYVLCGGSGVSQGKMRIFEQFSLKKSTDENANFLKNEYGTGGRSDAIPGSGLWEGHDSKGITIRQGFQGDPNYGVVLLKWPAVAKRISELIAANRYLNKAEQAQYPAYLAERAARAERGKVSEEFRSLIRDYNDFQTQLGNTDACLNQYVLLDCASQFAIGSKTTWTLSDGNYILPLMREALTGIISNHTHHQERAETLLAQLATEIALPLEPTYDELNPPPEPEKKYRLSLGDTVYLGTAEYEILSFDGDTVLLFDPAFPIINKELPRAEFDERLKENPLNDHLLVEVLPAEERTENPNTTPIGDDDYYFNRPDRQMFEAVYYNPDANAGGQFVVMQLPYELIQEARDKSGTVEGFFEFLDAAAYTELIDLGTPEYDEFLDEYADPHPDRIGRTDETMQTLISEAESDLQERNAPEKTPWQEYSEIKERYSDAIVLYQVGDFFEVMGDDAEPVAKALELTLTSRAVSADERIPMCGVPGNRLSTYADMLNDRGFDVVIAEQSGNERRTELLLSQHKDAPVESVPVGRIEYLGSDGRVSDVMEYIDEAEFIRDIMEENHYGTPMSIKVYRHEDGSTIAPDFAERLDPPPQGFEIIDAPVPEQIPSAIDEPEQATPDERFHVVELDRGARIAYGIWDDLQDGYYVDEDGVGEEFSSEWQAAGYLAELNKQFADKKAKKDAAPVEQEAAALEPPKPQRKPRAQSFVLHPEIPQAQRHNFRIADDALGVGTPGERFRNNIAAIRLLKQLEEENRFATPAEQEILSRYVGWGGLADCFDEKHSGYGELKALLSEDEYASARESTLTAFYTPPTVIRGIYQALENMSFKTGNILEPSCGIGHFIGMLPDSMESSRLYGVELDNVSGRIAQQLYQKSSVAVQGFEKTDLPDSFFDAAIGNVPFGQFKVPDKKYDKHNWLIHDYFFGRTLDKVRPGGIIAFVTSKGTLDKENPAVRKYIAQRADLLGAIRLPNNTFKSAAGTEVTSDIIFLQKRDRLVDIEPDWVHLGKDENGVVMNQYFINNPEMILGEMQMVSGQFGPESACVPYEGQELGALLSDAIQNIHAEVTDYEISELEEAEEDRSIPADPAVRNFSFTLEDGKLYYRVNSRMNPVEVSVTAENRIKGMIAIRDCVRTLIEYQTEDYPDSEIREQQEKLNALYDDFSKKYGLISSRANNTAFSTDSSYCLLSSLEVLDDEGNFVRKADMFSKRTIKQRRVVTSVDTASEALSVSLSEKAKVDMAYMEQLTGKSEQEIFADLQGVIFLNPMHTSENDGHAKYLTADEYLSGNVREKLDWARRSAELYPQDYAANVQALEAVQPVDLTASEISVRLGATWLPTGDVEDFMFELFSTPRYSRWNIHVHFSEYTGEWNIEGKSYDRGNIKAYNTYGTSRINGYKIIEETLNLRDVRIFDYVEDAEGRKQAVLNRKETAIAQGKQELIKAAFADWIWKDPSRRERLCSLYNNKFNSNRAREYDGSFLSFAGINPEITLRKHQINAVARGMLGGNELLAHVVGAGKTYTMVAIAQESKRLGLCQKSLFVVPNHLTEQWASEYLQLYPSANILVATKKDFEAKNRKRFCGRIATGDYDAVIIGHSQFEKIPMSVERQRAILEQQLEEITNGIIELKANRGESFSVKQLEKSKKTVKQKLEKLNDQTRKDDLVTFEELGIDRLFIDEAHYYKNLAAFTKMRNVGGISQTEAMKSSDLYMKCRYLDELTGGRGVVFATGTPISNSMVEMYTMQKYLQYSTLRRNNLLHFDAWASTFGETVTAIELAPEGTGYRAKTRFAKFYNLPELIMMFREVADIQTADMLMLPVPKAIYHTVALKPSEQQKEMVASLSERAERVRAKMVDSSVDNMLLITNDGRKLALDQRLMNELLPDNETGKTAACAENVFEIWERTKEARSTQMVFCDLSTPHGDGKFNVYDDVRDKLIARGIPAEEIAYIHSAETEAKKKELFGKVRSGQIRVLLGSTQKMGAGTNVQQKLIALHHLDCPWRPADLQQREGRIVRQGNENPEVEIYSYVTENTFDAYLYQLVESKQKFIGQIMTSKSPVRSAEDVDEQALSYAEIKTLATGNPHIKEKMDLDIDVSRLKLLKANHLSQRYALEDQLIKELPQKLRSLEERIRGYEADRVRLTENTQPNADGFSPMVIQGKHYAEKKDAGAALLAACKAMTSPEAVPLGQYRGFAMELSFDSFSREFKVAFIGELRHTVALGTDIFGNIQRLDNALEAFPDRLAACAEQLENTKTQMENAKTEVQKPFPQEAELAEKMKRLDELNILLNMDKRDNEIADECPDEGEKDAPVERSDRER